MSAFRLVLGGAVIFAMSACSDGGGIEPPSGVQPANVDGTTTGTVAPTGGTTTGATATGVGGTTSTTTTTTGMDATSTTGDATLTTTGTPTTTSGFGGTTGTTSTTSAGTMTDGAGGATSMGGTGSGDDTTTTDGNAFGGNAADDGSTTTTTTAGTTTTDGGVGGQTSTDVCRVMLGDVPVCCTPQGENRANVDEVFALLNEYRISQGRDALAQDPVLEETMQGHCMHMDQADFFAHESPVAELELPWDRADMCGTNANAENIAWNQQSPAAVMEAWQNSSGHNQNMLTTGSTRVGIGEYNLYWGQIFGP